jgi:beta-glucosidase
VVQLYAKREDTPDGSPNKVLVGFSRIAPAPGQKATAEFEVPVSRLREWDTEGLMYRAEPGKYTIQVCSSSSDVKLEKQITIQ